MGSPTTLVLECRPSTAMATSVCRSSDDGDLRQVLRLEDYLTALEEERRKIEAFKRELPLCMHLLHDAIEAYKERLAAFKPSSQVCSQVSSFNDSDLNPKSVTDRVVLEEFIPIKKPTDESTYRGHPSDDTLHKSSSICKPSWMKASDSISYNQETCQPMEKTGLQCLQEQAFSTTSKPFFHSKNNSGGAFTPFSREKQVVQPINPADLALAPRDPKSCPAPISETIACLPSMKPKCIPPTAKEVMVKANGEGTDGSNGGTPARKTRRCWSPELHRRFVNALQQLGGPQVATPKQIRELMKVDGLTNDEVKSHLQKYRLHTRRPSPSRPTSTHAPQVVLLGGIWVAPEYAVRAATEQGPTMYSSSRQQSHAYQATSSQELCSQLGSPDHMHIRPSFCCDQKPAPSHSQSSLQQNGHSSVYHHSDDTGREESVGDDGGFENSSCKGFRRSLPQHEVDETEDQRSLSDSINGNRSHCTSEDDNEIENSRNSDTNSLELS